MGSVVPHSPSPPYPASYLAVKYHTFSHTISYAPYFTVVNYWQKLPANLAQILAARGKSVLVHHIQYRYTHIAGLSLLNFVAESSASGKPPHHSLPLPATPYHYLIYFSYLCTYDLYGPVRNAFGAGSIHYEGKWDWVGPWKSKAVRTGPYKS
jgi:hypothetical protein